MATEPAHPNESDPTLGPDDFHRSHPLSELLAGAEPLASIDDLLIEGLTDEEGDVFLGALGV